MKRKQLYGIGLLTSILTSNMMKKKRNVDLYENLNKFGEVVDKVSKIYVDKIDSKILIDNAIQGMVSNLDPYSNYISKDEVNEMIMNTTEEFGGPGIEIGKVNNYVFVIAPIDNTPAFKKLKSGDIILEVDGVKVYDLNDAVKRLRGKVGTQVQIKIKRNDKILTIKLIRKTIKIDNIKSELYKDENILYIRLIYFHEKLLNNITKELKKEKDNIKGLILDLRNNPGGLFYQSVNISELFLKKEKNIVKTVGRTKSENRTFNTIKDGDFSDIPIIILINKGSASASEILTAALKDNSRAIVIGTETFGKGSIQSIIPLSDNEAIRLTTSRYVRPNNEEIRLKIKPDIEIFDEEKLINSSLKLFPIMEKYDNDIENNLEKIIEDFKNDL